MKKVVIIDSGFGSFSSLKRIFHEVIGIGVERMLVPPELLSDQDLNEFIFVLPGIGSWDNAVQQLKNSGWFEFLKLSSVNNHFSLIVICLGFQLLFDRSDEGTLPGLSILSGDVVKLPNGINMGWKEVKFIQKYGMLETKKFYHVHNFGIITKKHLDGYGWLNDDILVAVRKGKIFGFQFHPEKSHVYGIELLRNVIEAIDMKGK